MTEKSKLAEAIEARPRKSHEFEVNGFFGLGDKAIHKIAVRVNTKAEQDKSIIAAHEKVNSQAKGPSETARNDADILTDTKSIHVLFHACRRCEDGDTDKEYNYPAFPGPDWMREHMTTDQLAVLLNLYNEVRIKEGPSEQEITYAKVDMISELCARHFQDEIPEALLAPFNREWLSQAFVLLSKRYDDVQSENEDLKKRHRQGTEETSVDREDLREAPDGSGESGEVGALVPEPDGAPGEQHEG